MIKIIDDSAAPQRILERSQPLFRTIKTKNGVKRFCRICNGHRPIDEAPCPKCGYKDGFCVKGIEIYA